MFKNFAYPRPKLPLKYALNFIPKEHVIQIRNSSKWFCSYLNFFLILRLVNNKLVNMFFTFWSVISVVRKFYISFIAYYIFHLLSSFIRHENVEVEILLIVKGMVSSFGTQVLPQNHHQSFFK